MPDDFCTSDINPECSDSANHAAVAPLPTARIRPAGILKLPRVKTLLAFLTFLILGGATFPALKIWQRHQLLQAIHSFGCGPGVDFHPSGPEWLRAITGEEFMEWFDPIRSISISRVEPTELPWRREFFSRLESLDVRGIGLHRDVELDKVLANFSDLPQLQFLALRDLQITRQGLASLQSAPRLGGLLLVNVNCSAEDFAVVRSVPQLKYLYWRDHITKDHFAHLEALTELEEITLWNRSTTDSELSFLRGRKKLTKLELRSIHASGPGIAVLNDLPSLENLILAHAALTDNDLDRLDGCPQLRKLDLNCNPISDAAITRFAKSHPRLKEVGFDGTNVTPECVQKLAREYGIVGVESISNSSL